MIRETDNKANLALEGTFNERKMEPTNSTTHTVATPMLTKSSG